MAKNIIFCADGTWNSPDQDENSDGCPDFTNVYKLFLALEGADLPGTIRCADEQEKESRGNGAAHQIAKYIHGVGDSRNPIVKLMGGAFGSGVISRIVRGYTFISRNYEPGADIYIIGFSRGAYTARALGGLIASQGLLGPHLTHDKGLAYRCGAQAWYRYREAAKARSKTTFDRLLELAADLPAFLSRGTLKPDEFIAVERIQCVAVWDTVGSMGIPNYRQDARVDAFKFADTRLSAKVQHGFHAVALDEQRVDFTPTLWDATPNVAQLLFPGAHADVGGGYPTLDKQSGLSDQALQWMMQQMQGVGARFAERHADGLDPDAAGTAHKPWIHKPWPEFPVGSRRFADGIAEHASIAARVAAERVIAEPGEAPTPYRPTNRVG